VEGDQECPGQEKAGWSQAASLKARRESELSDAGRCQVMLDPERDASQRNSATMGAS
jgi:hypothetical protein